ncbi:MAG TPA: 16S rRNA (adenine(1518)-N(6)/adenine(1519)-N(6))-dimethyltransferase RsmA [Gemmatimonadaceae bacterium]|nr:16S rRNA (adenine(1518)-N(6)/adenine(1519)-N(6))-dimethyltransferase RsmA [Gemmatimonadaceae bacterium]
MAGRRDGNEPGFPPVRKSLGQHFLTDRAILERIADAAALTPATTVIEIGPGRGALTDVLVERAGRVIAIEYDRALAAKLVDRYASRPHVEIVQADVLTVSFGDLAKGPYHLVGNVPYYITTPIIFQALEQPRPDLAVYLVQREVAERLVAPPGGGDYGALTVNVGAVADAEIMFAVPAGAFRPPPKVDSAVVRITPKPTPLVAPAEEARFRAFVQSVFTMRRKQMQRILRSVASLSQESADARLAAAGIEPTARPETVTIGQFAALFLSSEHPVSS